MPMLAPLASGSPPALAWSRAAAVIGRRAVVAVLVGVLPARALAWGHTGHELVAVLAESRLTPATRGALDGIIGKKTLASIANQADAIRPFRKETAPWHFADIPRGVSGFDPQRDCSTPREGDCVVAAVERFGKVIATRRRRRRSGPRR